MNKSSSSKQSIHAVVGKLFALITCRLEDAHGPSVDGHRALDTGIAKDILSKVETASEEITTLCEVIHVLIGTDEI